MKTVLVAVITHDKPLSTKKPLTDLVSERIYNTQSAEGVTVDVTTRIHSFTGDIVGMKLETVINGVE